MILAPSILSADFSQLKQDINLINESKADWFHIDIMDGVFVPNISFGFPVLKSIQKYAQKPLDVHLMIVEPQRYIHEFKNHGAEVLTVHLEACNHLHRTIGQIHEAGMKAGVAINPHTPVESLSEIIQDIQLVCLMSVNPGYGGQKFIPSSMQKIKRLKQLISEKKSGALIEVDGGVDLSNALELVKSGADVLVAGNAVFSANNPNDAITAFKNMG